MSIQVKCYNELVKYGAQQVLEREYGPYVVAPEAGYNFSVQVDLEGLPDDKGKELGEGRVEASADTIFAYRSTR